MPRLGCATDSLYGTVSPTAPTTRISLPRLQRHFSVILRPHDHSPAIVAVVHGGGTALCYRTPSDHFAMRIKRVQVEEGFLDGLDLSFSQGLNVIIGERGTGKTSLIELIRFCLGVHGYTEESRKRSLDHAISVLEGGQISVTLTDGERDMIVTRSTSDRAQRATGPYTSPIIFSQTEVETVGLRAQSRIRIIDGFSGNDHPTNLLESEAVSKIRSLTAQAKALRQEIDALRRDLEKIPSLDNQIADLLPQERKLVEVRADTKEKKDRLDTVSARITGVAIRVAAIGRFVESVSDWQASILTVISSVPVFDPWPDGAGQDGLSKSRRSVGLVQAQLRESLDKLQRVKAEAVEQQRDSVKIKLELEGQARRLRQSIDSLQQGAGTVLRRAHELREKKAELKALTSVFEDRQKTLNSVLDQRSIALDKLDSIRESRFRVRNEVAARLTQTLGPSIRVEVSRAGQYGAYAAAVADSLRGSGLWYNELSSTVAPIVSPRELVEAVDKDDFEFIAETTGITTDRAARVLAQLRDADLGAIAAVAVEDAATFRLLDGTTYKDFGDLSTGQRCTVVLPLVLLHTDRVLIVDQPEDHIDNAFIADTLIVSIRRRSKHGQVIFSTHNANIPVLGEAEQVIQLGSDGRRGFSVVSASLDDARVVRAITAVMEGGAEAFKKRVQFYSQHKRS